MKTFDLYKNKEKCCGCEACVQVCPKGLISMQADAEGFFYPVIIDDTECVNCERCKKVCPLKSSFKKNDRIKYSLGGYSKDENIVRNSASGGLAFTLSTSFINEGGIVYGVRYSKKNIKDVVYCRCETLDQLFPTRASKYVQARKMDVFKHVKEDLSNNKSVLFIGLPCEVAALYHFIGNRTEKLYTVDLICHGPTSLGVHAAFIEELLKDNEKKDVIDFSVRYKKDAWKPYYVHAVFDDHSEYLKKFAETDYEIAFQQLKRPSCSKCRFKVYDKEYGMPADMTIGDYHLAHKGMLQYNRWGSSQVSIHTDKGEYLTKIIECKMNLFTISEYNAVHYNKAFWGVTSERWNRKIFSSLFQKYDLNTACNHWTVKVVGVFVCIKKRIKSFVASIIRYK